jgi:hypothetical protein
VEVNASAGSGSKGKEKEKKGERQIGRETMVGGELCTRESHGESTQVRVCWQEREGEGAAPGLSQS